MNLNPPPASQYIQKTPNVQTVDITFNETYPYSVGWRFIYISCAGGKTQFSTFHNAARSVIIIVSFWLFNSTTGADVSFVSRPNFQEKKSSDDALKNVFKNA